MTDFAVEVLSPKLVKIAPTKVTGKDILELAEALVYEHGHVKGDSGDATRGFSIHGAVNEAAARVTGQHKSDAGASELRDEATELLLRAHEGQTDLTLNDSAESKEQVLAYFRAAREGETSVE